MYISYNWLKELVDFSYTTEELEQILTMLGIEVDGIVDFKKKYDSFFTAQIDMIMNHPYSDKLKICEVEFDLVFMSVVCGDPNVKVGQKVVLGFPGAILPSTGTKIVNKRVKNIESSGMLCSQSELAIGDESDGIWILPIDTPTGIELADYLGMNDIIFDISVTPNKPDCLSHLGIAREISAYNGKELKAYGRRKTAGRKIKFKVQKENKQQPAKGIEVVIEDAVMCKRYSARIIRGITVKESPVWLKNRLLLLGLRPVNVVVDVTNYVLMEQGQPLHAFDLSRIEGNKIICKTADDGEIFTTLDGKERILDSSMLMICDAKKKVAIGGVMGGQNSEIDNNTKDVLLESAFFNPSSIRKTAKKLGIQSDASYRFERGVDIGNVTNALNRAAEMIAEFAGGIVDETYIDVYPNPVEKLKLKLRYQRARDISGIEIDNASIKDMLKRLRFEITEENDSSCIVEVPYFRVDISQEIDLIEEITRLYNYDNIEPDNSVFISIASGTVPKKLAIPPFRELLRDYLVKRGFSEIITQNMIDPVTAKLFGEKIIQISNPLGEDLSVMRPSIVPSMLRTIERNIRLGNSDLKYFEIGKTFHITESNPETFIKSHFEKELLIFALCGRVAPVQWGTPERKVDFYDIKGITEEIIEFFRIENIKFEKKKGDFVFSSNALQISENGKYLGTFGELSKDLLQKFDIETPVYICLIELSGLYMADRKTPRYSLVAPYPGISRDLAFIVDSKATAAEIQYEIVSKGGKLLKSSLVFDVYEGKSIEKGKKSIAFALTFFSPDKTLTDEEVELALQNIITGVEIKFDAVLRKS